MQTHNDYFSMMAPETTQEESGEVQLVSFLVGEEEFGGRYSHGPGNYSNAANHTRTECAAFCRRCH